MKSFQRIVQFAMFSLVVTLPHIGCAVDYGITSENIFANTNAGIGQLGGKVTLSPTSPVERTDQSYSKPAAGIKLVIRNLQSGEIKTVMTNEQGDYYIDLGIGPYTVNVELPAGIGFTKDLPKTVTIDSGQTTQLNIRIDTGIR